MCVGLSVLPVFIFFVFGGRGGVGGSGPLGGSGRCKQQFVSFELNKPF